MKIIFTFTNHLQGRILTVAGVTAAICSAPFVSISNLVAIAVWPTWTAVAISETLRKVGPCGCQFSAFNSVQKINLSLVKFS